MMYVYLGEEGLNATYQAPFEAIIKCKKCGGEARIMFVACEDAQIKENSKENPFHLQDHFVCDLRQNGGKGDYWLHDACAVAVYLCKHCFEPNAVVNQG